MPAVGRPHRLRQAAPRSTTAHHRERIGTPRVHEQSPFTQDDDVSRKKTPVWTWIAGGAALAVAIGAGVYFADTAKPPVTQLPAPAPANPPAAAPATPPIEHPIEQAAGADTEDTAPLPPLDASDAAVLEALRALVGDVIGDLLNPQHVIQRIVATIDSLPRQKLAFDALPVRPAQGTFVARSDGARSEIDARNYTRYAAYVRVAQAIDAEKLVGWYAHFYPLFQEAYRELGYKDGYFNDRLVFVIDHLLATPDLAEPAAVTRSSVTYEYADPALESRSAGQKLLLRTGPENEAAIKVKLREIRAALTGRTLPPA